MSNWINKCPVHIPKDGLQYKPQEKNCNHSVSIIFKQFELDNATLNTSLRNFLDILH